MRTLLLILVAVIAYCLGGLNGAIITSRLVFRKDVRSYGSHNAGLTNFLRTFGAGSVAGVIVIDVLKSLIAVILGGALMNIVGEKDVGQIFAAFCLVLGHVMPVLYRFRGGKGVLCAGTFILVFDWRIGLICWAVFVLVVVLSKYVSVASMISSLTAPIIMPLFGYGGLEVLLTLLVVVLVVIKHAENILRLIGGTENTLSFGPSAKK